MIYPKQLTQKWPLIPLGKCVTFLDHLRKPIKASLRQSGAYPYYGANGQQGTIDDFIFDEPLLLLAEDGGFFGQEGRNIAYRISGKTWVNNHAHVLRPNKDIDLNYLCHVLAQYDVTSYISGTTRAKLTKAEAQKILIPVPSITTQNKIAKAFDLIDDLRRKRQEQIDLLDTLVKSRFVEMFGDPVNNEKGWKQQKLIDLCNHIVDCPHSTPEYTTENTGYMCVKTSIIKQNTILWDKIEYIQEYEYHQRIKRKKPMNGDIIYTREGAILGIAAVIDRDCNIALGQRSMLLSPNKDKCTATFLCRVMNFDTFLHKATAGISGSASPHINVADIKNFSIISPPLEIQQQFSHLAEQSNKSKLALKQSLAELDTLKKALMQKFFG